jgi:hypothetical protein
VSAVWGRMQSFLPMRIPITLVDSRAPCLVRITLAFDEGAVAAALPRSCPAGGRHSFRDEEREFSETPKESGPEDLRGGKGLERVSGGQQLQRPALSISGDDLPLLEESSESLRDQLLVSPSSPRP